MPNQNQLLQMLLGGQLGTQPTPGNVPIQQSAAAQKFPLGIGAGQPPVPAQGQNQLPFWSPELSQLPLNVERATTSSQTMRNPAADRWAFPATSSPKIVRDRRGRVMGYDRPLKMMSMTVPTRIRSDTSKTEQEKASLPYQMQPGDHARQMQQEAIQKLWEGFATGESGRDFATTKKIANDFRNIPLNLFQANMDMQRGGLPGMPSAMIDLTRGREQPSPFATWGRNLNEEMEAVRNNMSLPPGAASMMDAIEGTEKEGRAPSHSMAVDRMFNSETMSGATVDQYIGLLNKPYIKKVLSQYPGGEKATKSMVTNLLLYQTRSRPTGRDRPTGSEKEIIKAITEGQTGVEKGRRVIQGLRRGRALKAASKKVRENVYGSEFRRAMERANSL